MGLLNKKFIGGNTMGRNNFFLGGNDCWIWIVIIVIFFCCCGGFGDDCCDRDRC